MSPEGQAALEHIRRIGAIEKLRATNDFRQHANQVSRELGIPTRFEAGMKRLSTAFTTLSEAAAATGKAMKAAVFTDQAANVDRIGRSHP